MQPADTPRIRQNRSHLRLRTPHAETGRPRHHDLRHCHSTSLTKNEWGITRSRAPGHELIGRSQSRKA